MQRRGGTRLSVAGRRVNGAIARSCAPDRTVRRRSWRFSARGFHQVESHSQVKKNPSESLASSSSLHSGRRAAKADGSAMVCTVSSKGGPPRFQASSPVRLLVGLMVPEGQGMTRVGDVHNDGPVGVLDKESLDPVVDTGLSGIGEDPLRGGTRHTVEPAGTFPLIGVKRCVGWIGGDGRVVRAVSEGQVLQMELTVCHVMDVDLKAVGLPGWIAMKLEAMRDPSARRNTRVISVREDA